MKNQKYESNTKINRNIIRKKTIKKIIFYAVMFIVLLVFGTILLNKSLQFDREKVIKYTESSKLDYKVYLKENDFYDDKYLGKDMLYVASLIDKLAIDFDYNFESEDKESIDFSYSIIAKLSIDNISGTKSYFEKTYTLLNNKEVKMIDSTGQSIKEQISIDYPYYNSLANSFKNQYGVDANSKLTIYMLINKKNSENSNFILDNNSIMNIIVPLSERSVDISLDYKEINDTSNIIKKQSMSIKDYVPLILSVLFIILSLIMMIKCMRNINSLRRKKSEYDKQIAKILKEYDRLIAESNTLMSFDNKEIININKFTELLDIHDNLQLPIMYYEVEKHKSSYFYISHENVLYLLEINAEKNDDK